jgi:diguanylate cyclase (GGDEF)-like protein
MNPSATLCSQNPTIMIVDDTPANVAVLADHLEDRGFQVVVAQDGEEGLKRAQLVQPDLILLDVMMPGIDGFETCRRLKLAGSSKDIPVIFMTALAETNDKVKGFEAGGVDYVTKPFRIEEVLARIKTHLALREMQQQLAAQNLQLQQEAVARKRAELMLREQGRVLEMIATGTPLEQVFESLMVLMESQLERMMASILLLEDDGLHLRHAAAPSLPQAYTQVIDGLCIGPQAGSCGTAIHRREQVIVSDILQDPLWDDYRELATPHGLRSCWSTPIITHQGKLLGTLALYSQEVRTPTLTEAQLIDMATRIAGIAIERRDAEQRISHMAHHDALTGLPNRILLEDRLKQAMLYAHRYGRQVTVAFMDLDNFKLINDSLGHNVGDEILKTVADRMKHCVRATDTVVRLGGDEFVIILFDQPDQAEVITQTLHKIHETIAQAIYVGAQKLQVTCSMGLASYPNDGAEIDTLLMNADAAMYRAKELGRNNYQFYTAEMNAKVHEKLALQEGLRNAIAGSEFLLLYQPQVNLQSGQIFGVEALIRWQHPALGLVAPAKFISLAEESGLIVPIGDWVLRTACKQNKAWQDAGMPPITISVNVSARQFKEKSLVSRVAHALQESGLQARYLELELTESLIMQDLQQAIATMRELQMMGVQLAIDDFGTGYSSLSALKSFPIVRLKIDQSFVRDLSDDEDDKAIVMAVISLGHKLNLKVIAEGVETEQQLMFLRDNDCDEMQGYHFSKPVSADEVGAMFQTVVQSEH